MATPPAPYAGGVLRVTNELLEKVGIQSHIESFKELTGSASSMFVAVFEKTFGVLLDAIIRKPVHVRDYVHNANVVIGALQNRVLHMQLPNINGEAIVRGDATAILNLVSVFMEIVTRLDEAGTSPSDAMPTSESGDVAEGRLPPFRRTSRPRPLPLSTERFPLDLDLSSSDAFAFSGETSDENAPPRTRAATEEDWDAVREFLPLPDAPDAAEDRVQPPTPPRVGSTSLPEELARLALDYPRLWEGIAEEADDFAAEHPPRRRSDGQPVQADLDAPDLPPASAGRDIRKLRATLHRMQREQDAVARQQTRLENRRLRAAARSKQHHHRAQQAKWRKHAEALQLRLLSQQLRRQNDEHVKLRQLYRAVLRSARQQKRDEAAEGLTRVKELERNYEDLCESTSRFFDDRMRLLSDAGSRAKKARGMQIDAQRGLLRRLLDEAKAANEVAIRERMEKLEHVEDGTRRAMSEVQNTAAALLNVDVWEAQLEDRFLGAPAATVVAAHVKRGRMIAQRKDAKLREKQRLRRLRQAYGS